MRAGIERQEAMALLAAGQLDELLDRMLDRYERYKAQHDMVIVEVRACVSDNDAALVFCLSQHDSASRSSCIQGTLASIEVNSSIAASLFAPVVMVLDAMDRSGNDRSSQDLAAVAQIRQKEFVDHKCDVAGLIVNQACAAPQSVCIGACVDALNSQ